MTVRPSICPFVHPSVGLLRLSISAVSTRLWYQHCVVSIGPRFRVRKNSYFWLRRWMGGGVACEGAFVWLIKIWWHDSWLILFISAQWPPASSAALWQHHPNPYMTQSKIPQSLWFQAISCTSLGSESIKFLFLLFCCIYSSYMHTTLCQKALLCNLIKFHKKNKQNK